MLLPPRIEYYGDIDKGQSLKGMALSFYNFVCQGMGEAWTVTREKRVDDDGILIQAQVTKTAYGNYTAVLKIYVRPVTGGDEEIFLFCTSFTAADDAGTLVYKKPKSPLTQGGLVSSGSNPTGLILPTPDYKSRTNYWVNSKESETLNWEYVNAVVFGQNRRYGKIAINGIETDTNWGLYYEPLACALISDTKLIVIYFDRVNYSGTGTTIYAKTYSYTLDFTNQLIQLSELTSLNLTALGYSDGYSIHGIMGDAKTVIYTQSGDIKYYKLADNYLSIASNGTIYQDIPNSSSNYTTVTSGDTSTTTLNSAVEGLSGSVDVRGDAVYFVINEMDVDTSVLQEAQAPYYNYFPVQTRNIHNNHYGATYKNGLVTRKLLHSSTDSRSSSEQVINENRLPFLTINNTLDFYHIALYSEVIKGYLAIHTSQTTTAAYWEDESNNSTTTGTMSAQFNSKTLLSVDVSTATIDGLDEYSYTKNCLLASFLATNPFTVVMDLKGGFIVKNHQLNNLSVTKLPKATP